MFVAGKATGKIGWGKNTVRNHEKVYSGLRNLSALRIDKKYTEGHIIPCPPRGLRVPMEKTNSRTEEIR